MDPTRHGIIFDLSISTVAFPPVLSSIIGPAIIAPASAPYRFAPLIGTLPLPPRLAEGLELTTLALQLKLPQLNERLAELGSCVRYVFFSGC